MKNKPQFYFDAESGESLCILRVQNKTYVGSATCTEADRDMMSEKTGCEIAYHRAIIHSLEDHCEELRHKLSALQEYYYSMNTSKWFNEKSYEARRLNRHITMHKEDLQMTKDLLHEEREYLKNYMSAKADFYKRIRANRKADSNK